MRGVAEGNQAAVPAPGAPQGAKPPIGVATVKQPKVKQNAPVKVPAAAVGRARGRELTLPAWQTQGGQHLVLDLALGMQLESLAALDHREVNCVHAHFFARPDLPQTALETQLSQLASKQRLREHLF